MPSTVVAGFFANCLCDSDEASSDDSDEASSEAQSSENASVPLQEGCRFNPSSEHRSEGVRPRNGLCDFRARVRVCVDMI